MSALQRVERIQRVRLWEPEEAYDFAAPEYDSWYWQKVWRAVERDFVDITLRAHHGPLHVLDVGCGTGTLLGRIHNSTLAKAELVGIDVSQGMLKRACDKFPGTPIQFIHGDFLDSHFRDRWFDVVFMCRVASHIADLRTCFRKIASLIKKKGTFAFSDVSDGHPYECTKLPLAGAKIPVVTYKHSLPEIVKIASECSLVITSFQTCSVDNLSCQIKSDPELPRTLTEQLESGLVVPFGCLMTFSLRA